MRAAAWWLLALAWVLFVLLFGSWWVLLPIALAYAAAWLVSLSYGDIETGGLR